jgi:hypothetical protein
VTEPSGNRDFVDQAWLANDPVARQTLEDFTRLVRIGSPDNVRECLDRAVWPSLDRAALWLSSCHVEWEACARTMAERTCALMLPTMVSHLRALTALARDDLDHLATAMAIGRAAFETGLRIAWVFHSRTLKDMDLRALALHQHGSVWKGRVASTLDSTESFGSRWRHAATAHAALVKGHLERNGWQPAEIPCIPNVERQLKLLGLGRLYHGYRVTSAYVHGEVAIGVERAVVEYEQSPYGTYWPQDWYLAVNMCAWACLFVANSLTIELHDIGPVRGAMWATEALLASPGPPVST